MEVVESFESFAVAAVIHDSDWSLPFPVVTYDFEMSDYMSRQNQLTSLLPFG